MVFCFSLFMNVFITDRAAGNLRKHYGPNLEALSSKYSLELEPAGADLDSRLAVPKNADAVVCDYYEWVVRLWGTKKHLVVGDEHPTMERGAKFVKIRCRNPLDNYCSYEEVGKSLEKIEAALSSQGSSE